jgi:hypothetical protein
VEKVQILALKEDYTISDVLNPLNVQWNRQYYECGTFSIQIPFDQYKEDMVYIYSKDEVELGVIDKVRYSISHGAKTVQLSGVFLENELDDKVVVPDFKSSGVLEDEVVRLVNQYKKDIPLLVDAESKGRGNTVEFVATEKGIGTELYKILENEEYSFRVAYDYESNSKTLMENINKIIEENTTAVMEDVADADEVLKIALEGEIDAAVQTLMTNTNLSFFCMYKQDRQPIAYALAVGLI